MKYVFYKTIKGRFLIITAIIMLIFGLGTSTLGYIMFSQNLRDNQIHSAETNLQFMGSTIDTCMKDILSLSKWSRTAGSVQDFMLTDKERASYNTITSNAVSSVYQVYLSNKAQQYIQRIVIANKSREDYLQIVPAQYSTGKNPIHIITELPYYDYLVNATEDYDFTLGPQKNPFQRKEEIMLPIIRPIGHPYENTVIGFSYIQLSFDLFIDPLKDYARQENTSVYFTIANTTYKITKDDIVLTDNGNGVKDVSYHDSVTGKATVHKTGSGAGTQLFVSLPLETEGCSITLPLSSHAFEQQFSGYLFILLVIFLSTLIIGIFLTIALNRSVTQPLKQIQSRVASVAQEDFKRDPSIEWDNELGDLGRNINRMAEDIQALLEQKIEFEKQKKDYEYQVLQSQINPHFLYNTLNSIKWMATIQKVPGIAEMTTALAHLLKNIAKGTTTVVSLRAELELLNDYYVIQKYRYGGAICLNYEIEDPELLDIKILRFTLQPIVENSIFHGIEPKGQNGHIKIHIYRFSSDQIKIDITDDGIGMDEEMIRQVLSDEASEKSHFFRQIGIASVNKRIQYNFGSKYGLTIQSKLNEYTTITILLPEIYQNAKGVTEDDKITDC